MSVKSPHQVWKEVLWLCVFSSAWALGTVPPAQGHGQVAVGAYAFVLGWQDEPVIVNERNALTVEITRDQLPVESGVDVSLEVRYAKSKRLLELHPSSTPGLYTAAIVPTVRGQYSVRLLGSINGVNIDKAYEPEEVLPADRLHFPEVQPSPRELQTALTKLEARLSTVHMRGVIALGSGVLCIILAGLSLIYTRRARQHQHL